MSARPPASNVTPLAMLAARRRPRPPKPGTNMFYDSAAGVGVPKPRPVMVGAANLGYAAGSAPRKFPRNRRMNPYDRNRSA